MTAFILMGLHYKENIHEGEKNSHRSLKYSVKMTLMVDETSQKVKEKKGNFNQNLDFQNSQIRKGILI